jgi:hypothetical protein
MLRFLRQRNLPLEELKRMFKEHIEFMGSQFKRRGFRLNNEIALCLHQLIHLAE